MRKKDPNITDLCNRLTKLEFELKLIKQQLKNQGKLIWFILGLIATIFVRVVFF
jgi:hypothetical protein